PGIRAAPAASRLLADRPHHGLALDAEAVDAGAHRLPALEEDGRLAAHADAGRRAGGDDVAGLEAHEPADIADDPAHAEDHRPGRAVLITMAIDLEPQPRVLRVADLVGRHQPRPERREAVAALALVPRAAAVELEAALRQVVDDAVAGDVVERPLLLDIARLRADDDAEL